MQERTYIQYLSKIHVEGYKILENAETHFLPGLNILIGKNGSGKSTFLEFVHNTFFSNWSKQRSVFYRSKLELVDDLEDYFLFTVDNTKRSSHSLSKEERLWGNEELESNPEITLKKNNQEIDIETIFPPKIHKGVFARISSILRQLKVISNFPTFVKFDLPSELVFLAIPGTISFDFMNSDDNGDTFVDPSQSIMDLIFLYTPIKKVDIVNVSDLNKLFPIDDDLKRKLNNYSPIKEFRISPKFSKSEDESSITISFIFFEFYVNDKWIIWDQMSDGTKRLFYIIFSFHYARRNIVLLEEPELGVHPHQLHLLMDFIKEESAHKQVIISTHSPYVLDVLNANELDRIIVTKYEKGKGTQFYHLTEEQKETAQKYINEFGTISDYWLNSDLEGEDK